MTNGSGWAGASLRPPAGGRCRPRRPPVHASAPVRPDTFRDLCLALPHATEDQPFGPDTLVFKVAGKIFATLALDALPPRVALKCDPERAVDLRERHAAVGTAPHFNKRHWNGVVLDGEVPAADVRDWVGHSYALVVGGLTRAQRDALGDAPPS